MTRAMTVPPDTAPPEPIAAAARRRVRRVVMLGLGVVLMVTGLALTPTPLPLGLPLMAVGVYLVARDSVTMREAIRRSRQRLPPLSRALNAIKRGVPSGVRGMIEATDPAVEAAGAPPD